MTAHDLPAHVTLAPVFSPVRLVLVDTSLPIAQELMRAFAGTGVDVFHGDIFGQGPATAIVSPANSHGWMDGGIDALYAKRWPFIEARAQAAARAHEAGRLPVGEAELIPTGEDAFPWMVMAPTMPIPGPLPAGTPNPFLAMRAALRACRRLPAGARVLCPGLGTWSGRVPPALAAWQMRAAWEAVRVEAATLLRDAWEARVEVAALHRGAPSPLSQAIATGDPEGVYSTAGRQG